MINISSCHTSISSEQITNALLEGWKNKSIPLKQRELTNEQMKEMYAGTPNFNFTVLVNGMKSIFVPSMTILEIGCSTGYYYEVLKHLLNSKINYTGVDYSEEMIKEAKKYYPEVSFVVSDGASLPFKDNSFSIVISGSILMHVQNYSEHLKETVRVSSEYVIVHRSIVTRQRPTQLLRKKAYGVEVFEVYPNERELMSLFEFNNLKLLNQTEYITDIKKDEYHLTYFLRKQ